MKTFHDIIDSFGSNFNPQLVFNEAERQFSLKPFKLKKFSIKKTIVNYLEITKKYENGEIEVWEDQWHKNQRKLFIQFLICYCKLYATTPQCMTDEEWNNLSVIFFKKTSVFLKFQGFSIMKNFKKVNWTKTDDDLIRDSIKLYGQGNWNQISKGVFFGTNHSKFFSPKQIRERWFNHISQNINRGNWSPQEDLLILEHVLKNNKRWCEIVKLFQHTRTEHMIKNRYKFLIKQPSNNRPTKQLRVVAATITKIKKKLQSSNLPTKHNSSKQASEKNPVIIANPSQYSILSKPEEEEINLRNTGKVNVDAQKELIDKVSTISQKNEILANYCSFSPNLFGFMIPMAPENNLGYNSCFMQTSSTLSPCSPQIFYSPNCLVSPSINGFTTNNFSASMNFWEPFQVPILTSVIEANDNQENQQHD